MSLRAILILVSSERYPYFRVESKKKSQTKQSIRIRKRSNRVKEASKGMETKNSRLTGEIGGSDSVVKEFKRCELHNESIYWKNKRLFVWALGLGEKTPPRNKSSDLVDPFQELKSQKYGRQAWKRLFQSNKFQV